MKHNMEMIDGEKKWLIDLKAKKKMNRFELAVLLLRKQPILWLSDSKFSLEK